MSTTRRGNAKELRTMDLLESDGWVVGSRRHRGGAGDILAAKMVGVSFAVRLIEVKNTLTQWQNFKPDARDELATYAGIHGVQAELAWWAPRAKLPVFVPPRDWPS